MRGLEGQRVRILAGPIYGGKIGTVIEESFVHGLTVRLDGKGGLWHGDPWEVEAKP